MNKRKGGGVRQENEDIKRLHEEWAIKNGYRDNDLLHAKNTERFISEKVRGLLPTTPQPSRQKKLSVRS